MSHDATGNRAVKIASLIQVLASLLWLPQAALLAAGVGDIAAGRGLANIHWLVAGVVAVGIFRAALDAVGNRLAFRTARRVLSEKRTAAAAALAARSPLDIDRPASGLAASVLAEQAEAIVPYLSRFRPARLKATIVPIAIFLCVLPLSWVAAMVLLVSAPLIPLFMALIGWRAKAASEKQLVEMGGMNAFLLDRLRGLATIRSLDAVDLTAKRLRANAESLRDRTMAVLRIAFLSSAVLELFAALGVAMVAVYIGFHLLGQLNFGAWGGRLSLNEGLFILLLAPAFFEPLRELSSVWHDRASGEAAMAALDRLSQDGVTMLGAKQSDQQHGSRSNTGIPEVCIDGLSFRHAGSGLLTFENFDLCISPGERVAVLGPSGSGKSTLLALIAGLAPYENGRIAIDGVTLIPATAAELRAQIAWVGQKPHIFAGSVFDNIALGRPEIGRESVDAALAIAGLQGVANARGQMQIGEGGTGLSGGEVLRLALARAAADPEKRLILADEPTAHLDTTTANEITASLLALSAGKTLIVATHDPVLASRMDRVIALEPEASLEAA
ncbi:thiol reductant ABC exporter subunit CydD [Phyllobacterium brassicacearum]|uniref:Thiol reductant ABC exporter subunit CydD n=1 Tax=Phyllobacterium brassicacearum TaxID=314235 RepID=A0A2P7BR72_9HYPH|nr:thiol reductant ABC exporter subunit CydD [Phyllobacterium brassicacearum]PSH68968.1 thiol reductant ABC exporter subunit CydD [Phyllobacterium brassicacearum]TDQ33516.1 ATP-binding cassette subfamily C protein CydD [Phyllobacterium brassicacearum]